MDTSIWALPWGPLLIFGLRLVDVSLDTMRVLFAVRGKRSVAPFLGAVQALVWIFAVGNAIKHLDSWWHILGYSAGYGMGTFIGITIEQRMAYGLSVVRIVSQHGGAEIAEALRSLGYGVTEIAGHGREGPVEIINSVVQRQHLSDIFAVVDKWDPQAMITVEEPKMLRGATVLGRRPMVVVPRFWQKTGSQRV
ncbi:MAG: DUF5698 domain-containing protein [Gemmatimonadaceae bacterium]